MDGSPLNNLPIQPTPFIGREKELGEIGRLIVDPDCRLLTLTGPGGSGKTRLSVEAAREVGGQFADGVCFVALQPVASTELVVPAIADAMRFPLRGQEEPQVQLINHLKAKRLLIVLDNFEHLVPASDLLSDMLSVASQVKLLVTTREALNLREEWVFPVPGMRFPSQSNSADLSEFDSVRLFVERARQVKRGYSPDGDWADIARLCQMVQGMPLGIELAASWIKMLTCKDIVAEIERNLDFLDSSMRNVPERHRSMRAVFDESWRLMSDDERHTFKRLSVFRGGFGREAAEEIAGASLPILSALADKSLLRLVQARRYQVHELLRQYAQEKLAESPDDVQQVQDLHCDYYSDFVRERSADISGGRQVQAAEEIEAELDNIRAAWRWAVKKARTEQLMETVDALGQCWQFKSRYVEAATELEAVIGGLEQHEATDEIELTVARLLVDLAWFYIRLGRLAEADDAMARCVSVYDRLGTPPSPGFATDPRHVLGVIATIKGEYAEAARLGKESLLTAEAQNNPWNRELSCYVLARAALLQGEHEAAKEYAQQAADIAAEVGDRWFMAYCLVELGNLASVLGDLDAARRHYQDSYNLRKEFDDPEGMALALTYLGETALRRRSRAEAHGLFGQALSIYQEIHDRGGLAASRAGIGKAAAALGDYETARRQFREALQIAVDLKFLPQILSLTTAVADMLVRTDETEPGLELLSVVLNHPASDHETHSLAKRILADSGATLPACDLGRAVSALRDALGMATDIGITALLEPAVAEAGPRRAPAYPDGLTEREVEVLRLIARGKSNRDIAEELFITANTAANHVKNILSKTASANRTEAAAYAIEKKLI